MQSWSQGAEGTTVTLHVESASAVTKMMRAIFKTKKSQQHDYFCAVLPVVCSLCEAAHVTSVTVAEVGFYRRPQAESAILNLQFRGSS